MTLYGIIWPCMALYGPIWSYCFSRTWPCVASFDLSWPCVASFDLAWPCVVFYGRISSFLAVIDPNSFGLVLHEVSLLDLRTIAPV